LKPLNQPYQRLDVNPIRQDFVDPVTGPQKSLKVRQGQEVIELVISPPAGSGKHQVAEVEVLPASSEDWAQLVDIQPQLRLGYAAEPVAEQCGGDGLFSLRYSAMSSSMVS